MKRQLASQPALARASEHTQRALARASEHTQRALARASEHTQPALARASEPSKRALPQPSEPRTARRWSRCAFVAVISLSAACGSLSGPEQGERAQGVDGPRPGTGGESARSAQRPPGTLKIATWNLEWLNRKSGSGPVKRSDDDYARLRRYADRLDADVVALQEVDGVEAVARVFDPSEYELYVATQRDALRTGFAYRKALHATVHPDYAALDVGQVRVGADLTVQVDGTALRLLSVHLKSGCFAEPLTSSKKDCRKLASQVPSLEAWIDARSAEGGAAIVLGDFNRRLFAAPPDALWLALDDADPPASDLWSPTEGRKAQCWNGEHPAFIDHIVLNKPATAWVTDSFEELLYDADDMAARRVLSDHCPIAVTLSLHGGRGATAALIDGGLPASPIDGERASAFDGGARPSATEQRIKGNVSSSGRKIYHAPNCPDYVRTQIDETKGERWFDNPADAEAAGFTKSNNCPSQY
jgi:endonuclease/exonuclease/phosphatase family metal-dependent hydrolase